jgi:hypothetical protein
VVVVCIPPLIVAEGNAHDIEYSGPRRRRKFPEQHALAGGNVKAFDARRHFPGSMDQNGAPVCGPVDDFVLGHGTRHGFCRTSGHGMATMSRKNGWFWLGLGVLLLLIRFFYRGQGPLPGTLVVLGGLGLIVAGVVAIIENK